jgi:hypothetical protein
MLVVSLNATISSVDTTSLVASATASVESVSLEGELLEQAPTAITKTTTAHNFLILEFLLLITPLLVVKFEYYLDCRYTNGTYQWAEYSINTLICALGTDSLRVLSAITVRTQNPIA